MNKDNIRKKLLHSTKKSVFRLILVGKICILPNYKVKKSVYTDKISMSGRSAKYDVNKKRKKYFGAIPLFFTMMREIEMITPALLLAMH